MSDLLLTDSVNDIFASLANAMPQLMWIAEADGKVSYFNNRITEFKGAEQMSNGSWIWQGLIHAEDQAMTELAWKHAMLQGTIYEIEHRIMMRNGQYRWYLSRAYPQKDETGQVIRWYGTTTDVHEQRKAQELLRLSEAEFRAMFEVSIVGMAQADANGKLVRVNDAYCELTGYSREELLKFSFSQITHPDDRVGDFDRYKRIVMGIDRTYFSEKRYIRKDGSVVWVIVTASPVFDNKGNFKHTIGIIQNITDRKIIEQAVEKLAMRLKVATDAAGAGTWYFDLVNEVLEWSDYHKQLWGFSQEKTDIGYDDWHNHINPQDKEAVFNSLEYARENHAIYEAQYRIITADHGLMKWIQSVGQFIYDGKGEAIAVTGISVDITDRKNREKELLEVKEQLELTVKNVPAGIMLLNKNKEVVFANDKAAWFLKVDRADELMSEIDLANLHSMGRKHFRVFDQQGKEMDQGSSPVEKVLETGRASEDIFRIEFNNGEQDRWIVYSCNPLLDNIGATLLVHVTITDITNQKLAEQQIRASEEQLRFLAESIPQLVWMADEKGNCEYKNERWYEYSGEDHADKDVLSKILHTDDLDKVNNLWAASLISQDPFSSEARLRNRHGDYKWHALNGEPIRNTDGKVFKWIGVFTDIDEQKTSAEKLELLVALRTSELQRSNEDLQQFAHVASHDLKEPLRKIKIFGSRLRNEHADILPEKAIQYISKIEGAAERMTAMVEGVLQYSSLNTTAQKAEKVDLNGVLDSIMSDLEIVIQQSGAIINYSSLPIIEGAPILIYQCLYNLVNNSLKFRREGRMPVLNIRYDVIRESNNESLKLVVEDNGIGFEMEYAESIFNSFSRLNSKDSFEGTGLGLALCKKIVERHNGSIEAWGEPGVGARFTVYLPVKQFDRMI